MHSLSHALLSRKVKGMEEEGPKSTQSALGNTAGPQEFSAPVRRSTCEGGDLGFLNAGKGCFEMGIDKVLSVRLGLMAQACKGLESTRKGSDRRPSWPSLLPFPPEPTLPFGRSNHAALHVDGKVTETPRREIGNRAASVHQHGHNAPTAAVCWPPSARMPARDVRQQVLR